MKIEVDVKDLQKLGYKKCKTCGGSGKESNRYWSGSTPMQTQFTCTQCHGKGYVNIFK